MRVSVCMATYNGANWLHRQVHSILHQLDQNDEVIVVDDASTDATVELIHSFQDPRVQLHRNDVNCGVVKTFERALRRATGQLIFLSDQDDEWFPHKVAELKKVFSEGSVDLIVHDAVVERNSRVIASSLFEVRRSGRGIFKNLTSNTYSGCCMAFRSSLLDQVLPIPDKKGILHDAWIGILAECLGREILFLKTPLISFVRHNANASTLERRKLVTISRERAVFVGALLPRLLRTRRRPR